MGPMASPRPRFRFAHMADIHLGAVRFDVPALAEDCVRAFERALDAAREAEVDFIVLAGDVFHRALVPPEVLRAAGEALDRVGDIPVVAIDGNHDTTLYTRRPSYVWYLGQRGHLRFLRPRFDAATHTYLDDPWDPTTREGFWCEPIEGVRVYGLGYGGATAGVKIERMARVMEPGERATLALFHGAIDRLVGTGLGEIRYEELEPLRGLVDYLACGHIHKRYDDGWAHNPGSLENVYLDEAERETRGFFLVDVEDGEYRAELVPVEGRPVLRPEPFDASDLGSPEAVEAAFQGWAASLEGPPEAILEVRLVGAVPFNFAQVDLERLRAMVQDRLDPAHVLIHNDLNLRGAERGSGGMDRRAIEQEVLREALAEELSEWSERQDELLDLLNAIRRKNPGRNDKETLDEVLEMVRSFVERAPDDAEETACD